MKKVLLLAALIFVSAGLFAQVACNPSDDFYTQVERWETSGLIEKQPSLRPYPLPVVEKILNTVIESGSETEADRAKQIYEETFGRPWGLMLNITGYGADIDGDFSKRIMANYGVEGDVGVLNNLLTAGYQLDFLSDVFCTEYVLPSYRYFSYYMADGKGDNFKNYMEVDGSMSINLKDFYFQTGINHNSFGPFYTDSLAFSPNAKHTANFAMLYNGKNWKYTQLLSMLGATNSEYLPNSTETDKYPNKLLMMHDIDWDISNKLRLSFYETVIYGKRFDPSYLIPMLYMVTQGITGYGDDNLLMGGSFVYKPLNGLSLMGDFYLDDAGITGILEYHDVKIHCAGALGLKYVPQKPSALQMIKADYTLVTPFMYSHWQDNDQGNGVGLSEVNYQIYTTAGQPLGSNLQSNSDRIAVHTTLKPAAGLSIDLGGAFIRHANETESLTKDEMLSLLASPAGYFATDGSIKQSPKYAVYGDVTDDDYLPSANNRSMILTQPTKEYTIQADLDLSYTFPETKIGKFTLGLGYTFEYIHNYGVGTNMLPGQGWYYDEETEQYYKSYDDNNKYSDLVDTDAELASAIAAWKSGLKNVLNHYLTINFKYTF